MNGKLYVVALPIGNLTDLSPRAKTTLLESDIIAAEDTRIFLEFMGELKLQTKSKVFAYHDHNEVGSCTELIRFLTEGKNVCLVSDAGTPRISDPGYKLISECFEQGIEVIPIPGPSSLTAAISVCPIGGNTHFFGGFLPKDLNEKEALLKRLASVADKCVFFESPHRINETLNVINSIFGSEKIFIAREMTKKFEEYLFASALECSTRLAQAHTLKGEFVLILPKLNTELLNSQELDSWLESELKNGISTKDLVEKAQNKTNMTRKKIYQRILDLKK